MSLEHHRAGAFWLDDGDAGERAIALGGLSGRCQHFRVFASEGGVRSVSDARLWFFLRNLLVVFGRSQRGGLLRRAYVDRRVFTYLWQRALHQLPLFGRLALLPLQVSNFVC